MICTMKDCTGRMKLLGIEGATANWRCAECKTEFVQVITVIARSQSGHGKIGKQLVNPSRKD